MSSLGRIRSAPAALVRVVVVACPVTLALAEDSRFDAAFDAVWVPDAASLAGVLERVDGCDGRDARDARDGERGPIVVCTWSAPIAKWLERRLAPPRLVHIGDALPVGAIVAASEGFDIACARTLDALVGLANRTRPARASVRRQAFGLAVSASNLEARATVADVANGGFSFDIDAAIDLDAILPGTTLADIRVTRDERTVAVWTAATIVRATPTASGYRVACAFAEPRETIVRNETSSTLRASAAIAGHLVRAVAGSGLVLTNATSELRVEQRAATVEGDALAITLQAVAHPFALHDVLRGRFELGGDLHRFESTVISQVPLRFTIPSTVDVRQRRSVPRSKPKRDASSLVDIGSPFARAPLRRHLLEASTRGLSFALDPAVDALPVGTRLSDVAFTLGGTTFRADAIVAHISAHGDALRCGLELVGLDDATRARLAERIVSTEFPGLEEGAARSFDELATMFRAAGYLGPDLERAIGEKMPDVARTFDALRATPNPLLRTFVYADGPTLFGHISSVRAYRQTYMIQHLAAAAGRLTGHAGLHLSLGNSNYLMHNPDFEYLKIWFHAHNPFPARVFGAFAAKVADPSRCVLEAFAHATVPTAAESFDDSAGPIDVELADAAALGLVERRLLRLRGPVLVRSDDLSQRSIGLDALDESYRSFGLERRRVVTVARHRGEVVGFALLELSSLGLNLFEALSRFSVYVLPEGELHAATIRRALIASASAFYRREGRASASLLIAGDEVADFEDLGLAIDAESSMCLTTHRSTLPRFSEHMQALVVPRKPRRASS